MLPEPVRRRAEEIARDRTRGAFPLALRVLDAYGLLEGPSLSPENADRLHRTLTEAQPWMVAVRNASLLARRLVNEGRGGEIPTLRERLLRARREVARGAAAALAGAASVVTLSYSTDVFEALSGRRVPDGPTVYVCESRPLQEGIRLVADLRRAGVEAILIADAAGPALVSRADAAVCGADALLRRGSLVNKIGTLSLALACREHDVPFRPLLEVLKLELQGEEMVWEEEMRDPAELSPEVEALNFYFEEVPQTLLDVLVTDAGIVPPVRLFEQVGTLDDLEAFYLG
ncbi:MAG: hypothetical protein ACE5LS_06780 [Thermoplasmata archaeon]